MRTLLAAMILTLAGAMPAGAAEGWRSSQARQIAEIHAAVAKYRDFAAAKAEGWRLFGGAVPLMGEHWSLRGSQPPVTGEAIDFSRPHNLMYREIGGDKVLVGVAYLVRIAELDPLPEGFAGPEDRWHVHNLDVILAALREVRPLAAWLGGGVVDRWIAPDGRRRLAMVHVWLDGRNPDGDFADRDRSLPYLRLGMPMGAWDGHEIETAYGLSLASAEGCDETLRGKLWLAAPSRSTRRAAFAACERAAEDVRTALAGPHEAMPGSVAQVWRRLRAEMDLLFTKREKDRMASLVESPGCSAGF
ncbi:MAG: hypothetical protein AAGG06_01920 [Pseudomonadota bacterium]